MFEEKATQAALVNTRQDFFDGDRRLWAAITGIQNHLDDQDLRLDRYASRLTKIMRDVENVQQVVDLNAGVGDKANEAIRESFSRLNEVKTAIELLATEIGTKVDILPEVPTTVTIQPGLPERLGLTKLTKSEKRAAQADELPEPLFLEAGSSGLQLVG